MGNKRALICGISGQDGAYLAKLLLHKGYTVYGTARDAQVSTFQNMIQLGIRHDVMVESMAINDFRSVLQTLVKVKPDELYNLAGQSSVGLSFQQPVETLESISIGTLNILEAIRFSSLPIKFYNACSGECFGDTGGLPADELTPFRPRSPYAVAKATSFWEVANYREAYNLQACCGLLFNHESPLRPERFVTQKIVKSACRIANGSSEKLFLGNVSIQRDWGWAPEYVEAMWMMLQQESLEDYVVATGETNSLEDFIRLSFSLTGLEWRDHVVIDNSLLRPSDVSFSKGNPALIAKNLGWTAKYKLDDVVKMMIEAEMMSCGLCQLALKDR